MRLDHIYLEGLKTFSFSGLNSIEIDLSSPIQLIVGENGSGKTQTLKEFGLLPPKKNNYKKTGKKILKISHEGDVYTLSSDFKNKDKMYEFFKNGSENLNTNNLITNQEELINKEFGIDQFVQKLLFNKVNFCELGKIDRKNFILEIIPFDLSELLDLHKRTCVKIRECNNNIKMLAVRQSEIEIRLVDKSILESKQQRYDELQKLKTTIDNVLFTVSSYITTYTNKFNSLDEIGLSISDLKHTLKESKLFLRDNSDIKNVYIQKDEQQLLQTEIDSLSNQELQPILKEIEQYQTNLDMLNKSESSSIEELELKLKEHIHEKDNLVIDNNIEIFNTDISQIDLCISEMYPLLEPFVGCKVSKIYPTKRIQRAKEWIRYINSKLQALETLIEYQTTRINKLKVEKLNMPQVEERHEICKKCILYKKQKDLQTSIDEELSALVYENNRRMNRQGTLERRKALLSEILNLYEPYTTKRKELVDLFRKYSIMSEQWLSTKLTQYLLSAAHMIEKYIFTLKDTLINLEKKKYLENQILKMTNELNILKVQSNTSKEYIEKILEDKLKQQSRLILKINKLKLLQLFVCEKEYLKEQYDEHKNNLQDNVSYMKQYLYFKEIQHLKNYYTKVHEHYTELQYSLTRDIGEISIFLEEQKSLRDRYENEINTLHQKLVTDKQIYELIEQSLSPANGIPYEYLYEGINTLIKQVNTIIARVWTSTLEIDLLATGKDITFTFSYTTENNTKVEDISELSDGQKAIVNFAWTITALIMKQKTNYPLFLDEPDRTFDITHKQRFCELLVYLLDKKIISQLFMINHHAIFYEGFTNSSVFALSTENIVTPEQVNQHAKIK